MIYGVDVSNYNTSIDWAKVKAAGKDFAIFKSSEGIHYLSPELQKQITGTLEAGVIAAAIYHFCHLSEDAAVQGKLLGSRARAFGIRPALDIETQPAGMTMKATLEWMNVALDACEQEYGGPCMLYSYYAYLEALHLPEEWGMTDLWLAEYPSFATPAKPPKLPGPWTEYTFWQYGGDANKAVCDGIPGFADLDVWPGTIEELGRWVGAVSPLADTEPPTAPNQ